MGSLIVSSMSTFLQNLDESLFRFINGTLANPLGDFIFPLFNSGFSFLPFLVFGIVWLSFRNSRRLWVIFWVSIIAVVLSDWLVFNNLKKTISRPRPAATLEGIRTLASGAAGGHSFPSSHTANCFLLATILAACFKKQRWLFFGFASMVGFARIYVGVHYPGDVLGSALLGLGLGGFWIFIMTKSWNRLVPGLKGPFSISEHHFSKIKIERGFDVNFLSLAITPIILIFIVQLFRVMWTIQTDLNVPPLAAYLWCAAEGLYPSSFLIRIFSKLWFFIFSHSPFSLWAIPWFLQTVWIAMLSWLTWKRGGVKTLWILSCLMIFIPLISQLSFLGSPAQIFEDSDFQVSDKTIALLFYVILGLPIWLAALFFAKSRPVGSSITILGLLLGVFFPQVPWHIIVFLSSGTILALAEELGKIRTVNSGWFRLGMAFFCIYGFILAISVYNPRFLRKLDISLLPRNSPHYVQTGWPAWIERIHPRLDESSIREIWTDSATSRDQVQYLLGREFQVVTVEDGLKNHSSRNALYIREVYLAQIHPNVIFVPRLSPTSPLYQQFQLEELDSTETFIKGDPIRQLQLFLVKPKA